jgi:hypothetical protein
MNNLYTFGCSFTEDFETSSALLYKDYKDFKGGKFPDSWPKILSNKLNLELKNYGEGASGNEQIFQEICKRCDDFKKGDIVIVEWSFVERYRIAVDDNNWLKIGAGDVPNNSPITNELHSQIILNRTLNPYKELVYDYENIIDVLSKSVGFDVYYWSTDYHIIHNLPEDKKRNRKYLIPIDKESNNPYGGSFDIVIQNVENIFLMKQIFKSMIAI